MTPEQAIERAKKDYDAVLGKRGTTSHVIAYCNSGAVDVDFDAPIEVRVVKTEKCDIERFPGSIWIDPLWSVEIINPNPKLDGLHGFEIYGTSYNLETDEVDASKFKVNQ